MTRVRVQGVGTSNFGKQSLDAVDLVWAAIHEALADAECTPADIDAIFVGNVLAMPGTAQRALLAAGFARPPVLTLENACSSGTLAVHLGVQSVLRGESRRVLAVGFEKMSDTIDGPLPPDPSDPESAAGMILPAIYGMTAHRYMHRYGVTAEQLASVSVKNHRHAMANPRAQYRGEFSVDEVLASRPIADPLTLLQCSPVSDGAAAVVLAAADLDGAGPVVLSSEFESGAAWPARDDRVWNYELVERVAGRAFARAGLSRDEVDVVELHDAFTIGELMTLEGMGFFAPGEAGAATQEGVTTRGGRLPVNVSGGLLSRGHPLGATGVAQVAEVTWQLRGLAGERQVDGAEIAVVETMGGNVSGLSGNGCVVMALARDGV